MEKGSSDYMPLVPSAVMSHFCFDGLAEKRTEKRSKAAWRVGWGGEHHASHTCSTQQITWLTPTRPLTNPPMWSSLLAFPDVDTARRYLTKRCLGYGAPLSRCHPVSQPASRPRRTWVVGDVTRGPRVCDMWRPFICGEQPFSEPPPPLSPARRISIII